MRLNFHLYTPAAFTSAFYVAVRSERNNGLSFLNSSIGFRRMKRKVLFVSSGIKIHVVLYEIKLDVVPCEINLVVVEEEQDATVLSIEINKRPNDEERKRGRKNVQHAVAPTFL